MPRPFWGPRWRSGLPRTEIPNVFVRAWPVARRPLRFRSSAAVDFVTARVGIPFITNYQPAAVAKLASGGRHERDFTRRRTEPHHSPGPCECLGQARMGRYARTACADPLARGHWRVRARGPGTATEKPDRIPARRRRRQPGVVGAYR